MTGDWLCPEGVTIAAPGPSNSTNATNSSNVSNAWGASSSDTALREATQSVLGVDALAFVAALHRQFEPRRQTLLAARDRRARRLREGEQPAFLAQTRAVRDGDWRIASLPPDLQCRRVEITGPASCKMIINALNSGADAYMADLEDSQSPTWFNQITGQRHLMDAVRGTLSMTQDDKVYRLDARVATLSVRPRGWHLDEKHLLVDGQRVSGALFDFGLYFFHNAHALLARGSGPYFYLPKLENHHEAALWNDVFIAAQQALGLPCGTIRATVLIETILAAFEMDEILHALREHSAGLNAGRWDYIFSVIKKFGHDPSFCLADRAQITMTSPFMRAYALTLLKTCHRRGAPAIGGMSALIPIRGDAAANERALAGVRADKARDASDGYDGGWVAHPGLVPVAMAAFRDVLGEAPNQLSRQRDDITPDAAALLDFQPTGPITEAGLRNNIDVAIRYLGAWLGGNGCVPIHHLMEDAATAEIARSQVWQWIRSPQGKLDDGRLVDATMVSAWTAEALAEMMDGSAVDESWRARHRRAADYFLRMATAVDFTEFLTPALYESLQEAPAVPA